MSKSDNLDVTKVKEDGGNGGDAKRDERGKRKDKRVWIQSVWVRHVVRNCVVPSPARSPMVTLFQAC